MRIWVTFPHDDDGIKEMDVESAWEGGYRTEWVTVMNQGPGIVHFDRDSAVISANQYRQDRIQKAVAIAHKLLTSASLLRGD